MKSASVVIVGAGIVGVSVAYHLAQKGIKDVVVLERQESPGRGSTSRATGGYRAQFGTEINVKLSLLAREKLLFFKDETGIDPGYRPCGYLLLARSEAELAALRAALRVQRAAGLREVREVTPDDVSQINPAVRLDGLLGGTYCPTDGFIKPLELLRGYVGAALSLGVRFVYGADVLGILTESGRVAYVRTPDETIATERVVNAAGAWAGLIARRAGVDLPVWPERRQVAVTHPPSPLPETMPLTIFARDGFHLRVRGDRVLLLLPEKRPTDDPFDTGFDERWLGGVVARARRLIPPLEGVEIDRESCWAGLYEMSPDRHALVGPSPGMEGFYLVNGSSGHGVMHAPILGQLLAEIIVDGKARTLDIHALRPSRFAEGEPNEPIGLL